MFGKALSIVDCFSTLISRRTEFVENFRETIRLIIALLPGFVDCRNENLSNFLFVVQALSNERHSSRSFSRSFGNDSKIENDRRRFNDDVHRIEFISVVRRSKRFDSGRTRSVGSVRRTRRKKRFFDFRFVFLKFARIRKFVLGAFGIDLYRKSIRRRLDASFRRFARRCSRNDSGREKRNLKRTKNIESNFCFAFFLSYFQVDDFNRTFPTDRFPSSFFDFAQID